MFYCRYLPIYSTTFFFFKLFISLYKFPKKSNLLLLVIHEPSTEILLFIIISLAIGLIGSIIYLYRNQKLCKKTIFPCSNNSNSNNDCNSASINENEICAQNLNCLPDDDNEVSEIVFFFHIIFCCNSKFFFLTIQNCGTQKKIKIQTAVVVDDVAVSPPPIYDVAILLPNELQPPDYDIIDENVKSTVKKNAITDI